MALLGLGNSKSETDQKTDVREITNTIGAQDQASAYLNSLGGLSLSGGGKKSNTNVTANISLIDGGALDLAEKAIGAGFDVTSQAINEASESRQASIDTAFRALDLAEAKGGSEGLDLLKSTLDKAVVIVGLAVAGWVAAAWLKG